MCIRDGTYNCKKYFLLPSRLDLKRWCICKGIHVCVCILYTQNSSTKDWCILICLDKWWVYFIFLTEVKLHFAYFLACASCTSLGCLYFQHHSAAYQPLNLYRTANAKWYSLTEHISISILTISDFVLDCLYFPWNIRFKALIPIFRSLNVWAWRYLIAHKH